MLAATLAIATPAAIALPLSQPPAPPLQLAQQLSFPVENIRPSRGRISGFSRGNRCEENSDALPLTPLIPLMNEEETFTTTYTHPRFYFYIPENGGAEAEFYLNNEIGNAIVALTIQLPPEAGIIQVSLPDSAPALELGRTYRWNLQLTCNDTSRYALNNGVVQRVPMAPTVANQLNQADPRDRPSIYARAELWYETLDAIATLRYANTNDRSLELDWQSLLESVNLGAIATAPLLNPSTFSIEPMETQPYQFAPRDISQ